MPYPSPFARLTWGGTCYNGAEIWQTGVQLDSTKLPDNQTRTDWVKAIQAWMASVQSAHTVLWVKWAALNTDGEYADQNSPVIIEMNVQGGWFPASPFPAQDTVVVSLKTAKKRGSATHGRMYPPPMKFQTLGDDGRISTANIGSLLNVHATLLNALNTAGGGAGGRVILASKGGLKTQPDKQVVTRIEMGRVIDTQRRRRSSLKETPTGVPLT